MLYQDNGIWKANTKKITYKMRHEAYDIDTFAYLHNPKFEDVIVEDVVLTTEQQARLDRVNTVDIGINDIEDYVLNGTVNEQNETLRKTVEDATLRELVARYVPTSELTVTEQAVAERAVRLDSTSRFTEGV